MIELWVDADVFLRSLTGDPPALARRALALPTPTSRQWPWRAAGQVFSFGDEVIRVGVERVVPG